MNGSSTFRVGLIQMRSGRTPANNMDAAVKMVGEAALAVLRADRDRARGDPDAPHGRLLAQAGKHGVLLLGHGDLEEARPGGHAVRHLGRAEEIRAARGRLGDHGAEAGEVVPGVVGGRELEEARPHQAASRE